MTQTHPRAVEGVHAVAVGDELAVHVEGSDETHLLGATTSEVWKRCDGSTSRAQLEGVFADQPAEHRAELAQLALDELERAGLVQNGGQSSDLQRESRRRFLRRAAVAAVAVPAITTIVTAQPAAATSHGCNRTDSPCLGSTVCDEASGNCVECTSTETSNCGTNEVCESNVCKTKSGAICTSSAECESSAKCCKRIGTGTNQTRTCQNATTGCAG